MANEEKTNDNKELKQDDIVDHLVFDPSQIPNVMMLSGFLGESSRHGYWRLYSTPELNNYVEFSEADVIHSKPLNTKQFPLGGTFVWVKKDAEIVHTHSMAYKNQSEFLTGDVANTFLGGNVTAPINSGNLIEDVRRALKSVLPEVSSCSVRRLQPHSSVPATCTLAFSCLTKSVGSGCSV
ncbi:hypothetical protein [Bacillus thuringiensis]|uniref:hypothetical protein n=1 Tax=Bacillus thuringiensis TaxID=1428 RepID=UPI0018747301|nr:hypothetical protein [Bacillus thuringiensis]MBE5096796.1 hypothetical protein [Bacillus thuringiensis]